jgi:hypothetical protein
MRINPYNKGNVMDWTTSILIIFFTLVALFVAFLVIGVRTVRKFTRWLFAPFLTPTRRR